MKHLVLKDLSQSANATITPGDFITKVNKVAKNLSESERVAFLKESEEILACVKNGFITFDVEIIGYNSTGDDNFEITISETAIGGRRSKARRTKKGPRKGTKRRGRGHPRS